MMRPSSFFGRGVLLSVLAGVLLAGALLPGCRYQGQSRSAGESNSVYAQREASPGGIGNVYMEREIAQVMNSDGAAWLDRPTRQQTEMPERLVEALALSASDVVADIGAGTGYFTFRLASEVPGGLVYAVDIQQRMIDTLRARIARRDAENVQPVHSSIMDPELPDGSIDLALMVDAYHEFSHPREMMQALYEDMEPGGRVVLVEYRAEDPTLSIHPLHTMTEAQIREELTAAGFEWRETKDILPKQHLVVFAKPTG